MPLKKYIFKLQDKSSSLGGNKRKVEHLLVKYSGIKITLPDAIRIISSVNVGREEVVLLNSNRLEEIKTAFSKFSVIVELEQEA